MMYTDIHIYIYIFLGGEWVGKVETVEKYAKVLRHEAFHDMILSYETCGCAQIGLCLTSL